MEDQLQLSERYDVKFMEELRDFWNAYIFNLINEIYVGVGINLGLSEKEAYNLAKKKPAKLEKAKFFKNLFSRLKKIFKYTIPKFRYKKPLFSGDRPITEKQWTDFNKSIQDYWQRAFDVSEDVASKAYVLGKTTTNFRERKKPYKNKSMYQIDFDQYDGNMPKNLVEAYRRYDFTKSEKTALNKSYSQIAMHVKEIGDNVQQAIRQQVINGIVNEKSSAEIASDLYWNVEKNAKLVNDYTAETLKKNWYRVASTELAGVYEAGILSEYEADAMESLKDPSKARYFVFTGGTCKWCQAHQGVLVRLVPASVVVDAANDSLNAMGIKDPNTDIAVWTGKNNIGFKETKALQEWRICTPAHPYNVATLTPIDIKTEWYNQKSGRVEKRREKKKYVPQGMDYSFKTKKELKEREPVKIDTNLVRYNNNLYEAVNPDISDRKLKEWREDPSKPIPVSTSSPDYIRIFERANPA